MKPPLFARLFRCLFTWDANRRASGTRFFLVLFLISEGVMLFVVLLMTKRSFTGFAVVERK